MSSSKTAVATLSGFSRWAVWLLRRALPSSRSNVPRRVSRFPERQHMKKHLAILGSVGELRHPHAPWHGAIQWFAMASVALNGRIDAVWNDTRNYMDAPDANLCELYYSVSTDAGATWSKNIPVSPVFDSHVD